MSKRLTKAEIFDRFKKVHGDKYDYSLFLSDDFKYERIIDEIPIICPIHGKFEQSLANHLQGKGCSKCKGGVSYSKEEFVNKSILVHGNKYDYSKTDLEKRDEKGRVRIICPTHGEFWQKPYKHLSGRGCNKCGGTNKKTKEELIKQIKLIHGEKYDTSKIVYINNYTDVILICPIHGEFKLTPHNLLCGKQGCPKCNRSKLETEMSFFLERNGIEFEEQKKFEWLGNLELDFYLPKHNIAIECQGIQHFKPIKTFGGNKAFEMQTEWDKKKRQLCEEHGIKLLYFSNSKVKRQIGGEFPYDVIISENKLDETLKKV